jgi:hypothetical protein
MRTPAIALLIALTTVGHARAQEEAPAPHEEPRPASKTTVRGTISDDLVGRWVAMGWMNLPNDRTRNVPYFWEITKQQDQLDLRVRFVWFPEPQNEAMKNGNREGKQWRPSPEDIAAVVPAWDHLPVWRGTGPSEVNIEIFGPDAFDDEIKNDARMKDSRWVIRSHFVFPPSKVGAATAQQVNVYGASAAEDGGYAGNFKTFVLAATPFMTPLNFEGTFRLYRVDTPRRGLLDRLADLFSGCGRR